MNFIEAIKKSIDAYRVFDEVINAYRQREDCKFPISNHIELPPTYVVAREEWENPDGTYNKYVVVDHNNIAYEWPSGMMIVPHGYKAKLCSVEDLQANDWKLYKVEDDY